MIVGKDPNGTHCDVCSVSFIVRTRLDTVPDIGITTTMRTITLIQRITIRDRGVSAFKIDFINHALEGYGEVHTIICISNEVESANYFVARSDSSSKRRMGVVDACINTRSKIRDVGGDE